MRKALIILSLFLCLLLSGCSKQANNNETPSSETDEGTQVAKIDANKGFIFVEKVDEYNLESIMNEANLESEFNAGFKFNSAFDLPSIDNSKALSNELIRVNINSEDGKRINDLLSTRYQSNYNERGVAEKRILEGEYSFSWIAQYLYETQETLDTVSLSVYSSMMNYPGSGSYTFESFVFRKSDGKLLNNEEVAEIAGTSMELIEQSIRTEFAQNQIDYYGTNTQRNLVEAISEAQEENLDELYFRIQQNNGLIITDTDVYVVLELYLGLSGAFESPIVYKIALDSIRK